MKRGNSLLTKVSLVIVSSITLVFFVYQTFAIYRSFLTMQRDLRIRADLSSAIQAKSLSVPLWNLDQELTQSILSGFTNDPDFRGAVVFNDKGKLFSKLGETVDSVDVEIVERDVIYSVDGQNKKVGSIRVYLSKDSIYREFKNQILFALAAYVVIVLLMSLVILRGLKFLTDPVTALCKAIDDYRAGERNIQINTSQRNDELGRLVRSFSEMTHELTALQRDLEKKVDERTAELKIAKKTADDANNTKSMFLANMSHELRTPLNGIIGMTEIALASELSPHQRDCVQMARDSGKALLTLINDILDISKIEAGKLDIESIPISLHSIVEDSLTPVSLRAYDKGLELVYVTTSKIPEMLMGDPLRLRQIVTNLVSNAVKFTEHGEVRVVVEKPTQGFDPRKVKLRISVEDTGIGISEEAQRRLFSSFNQADQSTTRKYGGTGLGLSISKQLVELMGGKMWLESKMGEGSAFRFEIEFPVAPESQLYKPRTAVLANKSIILAEENHSLRESLKSNFTSAGALVICCESLFNCREVLESRVKEGANTDLLIVSSHIMEAEEFTVFRELTKNPDFSNLKVLVTTPFDRIPNLSRLLESGVSMLLPKPLMPHKIIRAADIVLNGSVALSDAVSPHKEEKIVVQRSLKVLVTDDTAINRKVAKLMLEQWGHSVVLAESGRAALEALDREGNFSSDPSKGVDVVLMDIQMPELDGIETTALIREREKSAGRRAPVIALTAHALQGDRERFLKAGMDDYVTKPIEPETLKKVLTSIAGESETIGHKPETTIVELPDVDIQDLSSRFSDDEDIIKEIVQCFFEEIGELLARVDNAISANDRENLRAAAHALKGSLGNVSARRAWTICKTLEDDHESATAEQIEQCKGDLHQSLDSVKRIFKERYPF